jgi:hypothetical protein
LCGRGGHPGVGDRCAVRVDDDAAQDPVAELDAEVEAGVGDRGVEGLASRRELLLAGLGPAHDVPGAIEHAHLVFAAIEAAQGVLPPSSPIGALSRERALNEKDHPVESLGLRG